MTQKLCCKTYSDILYISKIILSFVWNDSLFFFFFRRVSAMDIVFGGIKSEIGIIRVSWESITLRRLYDIRLIIERVIGDLFQCVLDEVRVVAVGHVQHRIVPRVRRRDYRLFHVGFNVHGRRGATATIHHQHHRDHRRAEGQQAADQQENQRQHANSGIFKHFA